MRRRQFLKTGGLVLGMPLLAPRVVFSVDGSSRGDVLVCIFQRGGADGLNMVVPHGENRYYTARPNISLPPPGEPDGVIDLDGFFGLPPGLAALDPLYRSGELAIVHAVGSPDDSRSHFDAQDFMESGYPGKGVVFDGWINRHLQLGSGSEATFRAVGMGSSLPLSLRGAAPAIGLNDIAGFDLRVPERQKTAFREALVRLYAGSDPLESQGRQVFDAIDTLAELVNTGVEPDAQVEYPGGQFGQQLAGVAALIRSDLGVEVVCLDIGGWDHHDREADQLPGLLAELGGGLAAFRADLGDSAAAVTVITMTEFGRRVAENASAGTDHGHASVMLVLGGGVNGGTVHGDWPGLGVADLNRGDLEVTTDFRSVLAEALVQRRGETDVDFVFPDFDGDVAPGIFRARFDG